jgi:SAM-dependent methyltransferase
MSTKEHEAGPRAVYDIAADRYIEFVGTEIGGSTESAIDQSLLVAFTELVLHGPAPRVADLGCGPGRVAAFMAAYGLQVVGVDVSAAMVAVARAAHPHLAFEQGRLAALPIANGVLAGAVCWYSIIYTPPDHLGEVFSELARVVLPGGHVLLAFQAGGGEAERRDRAHGTHLALTLYRHDEREVSRQLGEAGLEVFATTVREPDLDHEAEPQAFVFARRL